MSPNAKAWLAATGFSAIALWTLLFRAPAGPLLLPEVVFYAVLVLNTFFSVRFYSDIQPKNLSQAAIDAALALTYIALALSLGRPVSFGFAALALFIAAPPKYALMLDQIPHTALLRRKILIDIGGTALCAALLLATLLGYGLSGAWMFAVVFALANVYLLLINPMYRL